MDCGRVGTEGMECTGETDGGIGGVGFGVDVSSYNTDTNANL